jgi:hypothetical protein
MMINFVCAIIAPVVWLFDHFCNAISWIANLLISWLILAVSLSVNVARILFDELLHGRARRKRIEQLFSKVRSSV